MAIHRDSMAAHVQQRHMFMKGVTWLQEQAYKGDLLGEYTGELVNQQEADRRGKAYDRDDNSYLFNLNEDWVIDARRRGNKLRFANHRCAHTPCAQFFCFTVNQLHERPTLTGASIKHFEKHIMSFAACKRALISSLSILPLSWSCNGRGLHQTYPSNVTWSCV